MGPGLVQQFLIGRVEKAEGAAGVRPTRGNMLGKSADELQGRKFKSLEFGFVGNVILTVPFIRNDHPGFIIRHDTTFIERAPSDVTTQVAGNTPAMVIRSEYGIRPLFLV